MDHFSAAHRLTQKCAYVAVLSFALFRSEASACERWQINGCNGKKPLLILRTDCWAEQTFWSRELPHSLLPACLNPCLQDTVAALIQPLLYLPELGKGKTCHMGGLSPSGKLQQDHKRLHIRCCIARAAWVLLYSSLPLPWHRQVSWIFFRLLVFIISP